MVYKAEARTTIPQAFLLTWLIFGLVPLCWSAGLGSKDTNITNGALLSDSQTNTTTPPQSLQPSSPQLPPGVYRCPSLCQCEYSPSSQTLEISCSVVQDHHHQPGSEDMTIDLSPGVRTLKISDALLEAKSVGTFLPPVGKNVLVHLDLHRVTLEPKSLFSSIVIRESADSLRKITISHGELVGGESDDNSPDNFRGRLQPLTSLQHLDSLNVCDSSPSLATIVLDAMPTTVKHLRAVNNKLYDIPYESLSHQYSMEWMDLSKNQISLIPTGLLDRLTRLTCLDVSHNRIYHLQEQVFTGLTSLRTLNVSRNQIEYVDAEVFTPLEAVETVDLSHNFVVQVFEPYFGKNKMLRELNMSSMWVSGIFANSDTSLRSLHEVEHLISTLDRVEKLDISFNGMRILPETLTHAPNLRQVILDGNQWECSCQDRWFLDWIATSPVSIGVTNSTEDMWCYARWNGDLQRYAFHGYLKNLTMTCTNNNIIARTPIKYQAVMGKDKQLKCHAQKPSWPKITWITPSKQQISHNSTGAALSPLRTTSEQNGGLEPQVFADGSLYLTNVTGPDYGLYLCIATYQDLNITHYVHLGMDVSVFREVRLMSIIVGWLFSFSFLLLVLIVQLIRFILEKLGVRCVKVATARQTVRVRAFFESLEQNKNNQLDWLRDNYNMQAKKIKDNCYSQLDRIRESYSTQSKNLGEIRDYGTQQLHTLRDQYNDQVRRVANYSAHQLCKVRENYVFKRNQVCKFSSHQLLRIRETYKWQAQTLNKILENLPRTLNFDTCRGMGACGRSDSIYLDDMAQFGSLPEIPSDVYHLSHHHRGNAEIDKMEHVSLLIPPEFVNEFHFKRERQAPIRNLDAAMDEEDLAPPDFMREYLDQREPEVRLENLDHAERVVGTSGITTEYHYKRDRDDGAVKSDSETVEEEGNDENEQDMEEQPIPSTSSTELEPTTSSPSSIQTDSYSEAAIVNTVESQSPPTEDV